MNDERAAIILENQSDHVLTLVLNQPEKRNAMDSEVYRALASALDRAEADPAVRVVAIRAEGKHFSAGVDLAKLKALLAAPEAESRENAFQAASVLHRLAMFSKPTIAAVHGGAHGGGCGLVLACDIAIATETASFSLAEVKLGLFPGLVAPLFASVAGRRAAGRYLLTGDRFDARTALALGVVHDVVEDASLSAQFEAIAARVAACAPGAVATTKRLLWDDRYRLAGDWDTGWIADEVTRHRRSPEAAEGIDAFLEKRAPVWAEGGSDLGT